MEDTARQIEDRIRRFIATEVLELPDVEDLAPDAHLLSGLLDSFGLVSLLAFLEETYEIQIDNTEVVDEHFGTIDSVADLVRVKRQQERSAGSNRSNAPQDESP